MPIIILNRSWFNNFIFHSKISKITWMVSLLMTPYWKLTSSYFNILKRKKSTCYISKHLITMCHVFWDTFIKYLNFHKNPIEQMLANMTPILWRRKTKYGVGLSKLPEVTSQLGWVGLGSCRCPGLRLCTSSSPWNSPVPATSPCTRQNRNSVRVTAALFHHEKEEAKNVGTGR